MDITASRIVSFTRPDRIVIRARKSEDGSEDIFLNIGPGESGYGKTYEEWLEITPPVPCGIF